MARKGISYVIAVVLLTAIAILAVSLFWVYVNSKIGATVSKPQPIVVSQRTLYDTITGVLTIDTILRNDGGSTAVLQSILVIGSTQEVRYDPGIPIAPHEQKEITANLTVSGLVPGAQVTIKYVFSDGQELFASSIVEAS